MLKIKRLFIIVLTILLSLSIVPVSAKSINSSSGSSGSGGGSSGGGSYSIPVSVSMSEFTAKGTIYLPDGFVAPAGGIDIYGGFGGVTFQDISLLSVASSNVEESIIDDETIEYEKAEVIATIPQGKSGVSFEKTFSIASDSDAFYGEFWVYNTDILSNDGRKYLSNKMSISNITRIKSNKYNYANVNVTMEFAENSIDYKLIFDDKLKSEKPNQTIFVIADDGYDKYITKQSFTRCDGEISGIVRTGNEEYELKYYIPSTNLIENQKITTGTNDCGIADFNSSNSITINAQTYISGRISRPNNDDSIEEVKLKLSTSKAEISVIIPQNQNSVNYIIGVNDSSREYIKIDILNSDYYKSGYYDGEDFYENKEYYGYIREAINDLEIELQRQCVIKGKINLPGTLTMSDKTWFEIYVKIESEDENYSDWEYVEKLSDKECEYKFSIPYEYKNDKFSIRYYYKDSITYDTSFPTEATNPLPYYHGHIDGGTRPGGGGSSGGGIVGYTKEMPVGLLNKRTIFTSDTGIGTFDKTKASLYSFVSNNITLDITLAKTGTIPNETSIGGYFINLLSADYNVTVQLLDAETKSLKYSQVINEGKYIFNDVAYGEYIISALYNGKKYYYTGKKLSMNIEAAKIIDVDKTPVSYGNDIYYENVFPVNIECHIEECTINGNSENATIGIYDINGNLQAEYGANDVITVSCSPFILSIDNNYVSEYIIDRYIRIQNVTNNIGKARILEAEYTNTINQSTAGRNNSIIIDITTPDYSISNIQFKDKYVEADVKKYVESEETVDIYYAVYYKGRLIDVASDTLDMCKGLKTVKSTRPLNVDNNSNITIRVFIWKDSLIPVAEYGELEI